MPYNLCGNNNLVLSRARTCLCGIDTIRFIGQKFCFLNAFLKEILNQSKRLIAAENYANIFISNLGFLWYCLDLYILYGWP